ncbi:MAG: alanine--glyoxylate aminotransferase family protein [Acidobacteriota bacterium]|nr:alanine--glyoxylate aminotransferase family protein [Acidobacteriota bacterium]
MARLLLGPGPSPVTPRVMRAMTAPPLSHLDPDFVTILDDVRARLERVFRADGWFCPAISGTGTTAMEAAIANTITPGMRATAVVNGYFGDRLAQMLARFGATVDVIEGEWGRAIDPAAIEQAIAADYPDVVTIVHAETSTGVLNPVDDIAPILNARGIPFIVDCVTSLGAMPVSAATWGAAAVYSCSQKGLGAPSGLAPIAFNPDAPAAASRSFALDRALLESFWVGRKYHHTISAPMIYALREALVEVEEETLPARWARHDAHHRALVAGLDAIGIGLLPPASERLPSLNAVAVPAGVDDAAVRRELLTRHDIEIGGALGPLAGRIWRVGLMGAGATRPNLLAFLEAFEETLSQQGFALDKGASVAAASSALA